MLTDTTAVRLISCVCRIYVVLCLEWKNCQGRMFQVEYAMEATRRGRTVVGVCGDGCVVLVTRDPPQPLSCRSVKDRGVWEVDSHVGIAASG